MMPQSGGGFLSCPSASANTFDEDYSNVNGKIDTFDSFSRVLEEIDLGVG